MSGLDNNAILSEIKALEKALASRNSCGKKRSFDADTCESFDTTEFENEVPAQSVKRRDNDCPTDNTQKHNDNGTSTVDSAYTLNKQLIESLLTVKETLTSLLEECNQRLALIDDQLQQQAKPGSAIKSIISPAGMPYFKDKDLFAAPKNEDSKLKAERGELQVISLQPASRWTAKDRSKLHQVIRQEAITFVLDNQKNKESICDKEDADIEVCLPKDFKELVGPLGKREFDWLKIATTDFDGRHSAEECRVMWNVFLHPDINKSKWTKAENDELNAIAEVNHFQNWNEIAKCLNTNRSGYQCFIRYNTTKTLKLAGYSWSMEEDDKLNNLVAKLKVGNYVPWGEVASFMGDKTKQQVYRRWMYSLAPHLKKGRFTKEEDKTLLNAVVEFGKDFSKISAVCMPNRSCIQLNDHYQTLIARQKSREWTLLDDTNLIHLYAEVGSDWAEIAKSFPHKNRTQIRHRYGALMKYKKRKIPLNRIPRHHSQDCTENSTRECNNSSFTIEPLDPITVDRELIDYFKYSVPRKQVGRKAREYSPDKLAENTEKLYNILQILNARLDIPDNLDNICVSNKEKQLLTSLKEYSKNKDEQKHKDELLENMRIKMFGHQSNTRTEAHFVPPLPYGAYPKAKKSKNVNCIDYKLNMNDKFVVKMPKEFQTPDLVTSFIEGDEEAVSFEKMSQLLTFKCKVRKNENAIEKVYIIPPTMLKNCEITKYHKDFGGGIFINADLNSTSKSALSSNRMYENTSTSDSIPLLVSTSTSCNNEISTSLGKTVMSRQNNIYGVKNAFPPTYTTLLAFKNLMSFKQIFRIDTVGLDSNENVGCKKSLECQKAQDILKRRLLLLFKFPIGMSHIPFSMVQELESTENVTTIKRKRNDAIQIKDKRSKRSHTA